MTFWDFSMTGTQITLYKSVVEFRHSLFTRQYETCLIKDWGENSIMLQSVYVAGPTGGLVCGWNGYRELVLKSTVVQGNVSGRTILL